MKMRNFPGLSAFPLLCLAAVHGAMAAPIASCPTTGTYQALINTDASGGCAINVGAGISLDFSNFAFTPTGAGTPAATAITYTLDDPGVGTGGVPIYGFEFSPGVSVTGSASESMLLSYLIVPVGTAITSAHLLENATATGVGVAQVSESLMFCIASDPNNTSGTCRTFGANPVTVSTSGSLSTVANFGAWTSMTVSKTISVSSTATGGAASITQVRDSVDLTAAAVPEPATYGLFSAGLLLLGCIVRRRSAQLY